MMLTYHLELAIRSLRRSKVLTVLMILAIAMGIGASMTTLVIYHSLADDPLPGRSDHVYRVQLDARELETYAPGIEPDDQLTRFDAETLLRDARAERQAMMTGGRVALAPPGSTIAPFFGEARYTSADFFPMFGVPLRVGRAWTAAEDRAHERVAVISEALNERLFGAADGIGKSVLVNEIAFRVIGVVGAWRAAPRFYDLHRTTYGPLEEVFVPMSTAIEIKLQHSGSTSCWGEGVTLDQTALNAPCSWIQYWAELGDPAAADAYRGYLENYSRAQHAAGRFERPANVRLRNVTDWLVAQKVVPEDARLQVWLAYGFLLVCLVNTIGLLLAKCLRRGPEIAIRRALGASRADIVAQFLIEAGLIGTLGGMLGLVVAAVGFFVVRHNATAVGQLIPTDWPTLVIAFGAQLFATLLVGLLPAWRGSAIPPAHQLKSA
jgi:putative ABC transport system permease protein